MDETRRAGVSFDTWSPRRLSGETDQLVGLRAWRSQHSSIMRPGRIEHASVSDAGRHGHARVAPVGSRISSYANLKSCTGRSPSRDCWTRCTLRCKSATTARAPRRRTSPGSAVSYSSTASVTRRRWVKRRSSPFSLRLPRTVVLPLPWLDGLVRVRGRHAYRAHKRRRPRSA